MASGRTERGASRKFGDCSTIELVVWPAVHYGFDRFALSLIPTGGVSFHGYRIECNEDATKNSIVSAREFLQRTIGGP
jgi:hypothetical protein